MKKHLGAYFPFEHFNYALIILIVLLLSFRSNVQYSLIIIIIKTNSKNSFSPFHLLLRHPSLVRRTSIRTCSRSSSPCSPRGPRSSAARGRGNSLRTCSCWRCWPWTCCTRFSTSWRCWSCSRCCNVIAVSSLFQFTEQHFGSYFDDCFVLFYFHFFQLFDFISLSLFCAVNNK